MTSVTKCMPFLSVGHVVQSMMRNEMRIVKVRCNRMRLDKRLLMYFPAKKDRWCVDHHNTKIGDIVVIKNLDTKLATDIFTKVDYIMYETGATIDPITGRRCRGTEFIDEEAREAELPKRKVEELVEKRIIIRDAP